jgi:GGDEF domain-containing protein
MKSLSPFRRSGNSNRKDHALEALHRVISVLLQGIALHAFDFDSAELAAFQTSIRKLRADIDNVIDDDSALLMAASAIRLLEDHNLAGGRHLQARQNEMEAVIGLLTEALFDVARVSPETMVHVREIERDIASATRLETLAAARTRLVSSLERIRLRTVDKTPGPFPAGETDFVTGLPDSGYAVEAMSRIWNRRGDYFAAMFALERLDSINVRFGFKAGDQVLLILTQHVAQHLMPEDQLFRWRGPCLVALVKRKLPETLVAAELNLTASARLEHAITKGSREVVVPISRSWNLFPLSAVETVEAMVSRLNEFAISRSRPVR